MGVSARRSERLTPRPMPTTAMLVLATAMEATAMVAFMATARSLLTLRPMPTTAMLVLATAMEATATAATARGQLMPSPTTDTDTWVSATAMAATVWGTPTARKTACLLPRTTFKGGTASTDIAKKVEKKKKKNEEKSFHDSYLKSDNVGFKSPIQKVQFQVFQFLIKIVISSQNRSLIGIQASLNKK